MEKEDILAISRRENKNRDLAEAEMSAQAGSIASRIGAERAASFRFYLFGLLTRCFSAHGSSTSAFLVRIIW